MNLEQFQLEHRAWIRHNFPDQTADDAFLGMVEEIGELAHAMLKQTQRIREYAGKTVGQSPSDEAAFKAAIADGIGDLVIFTEGFAHCMGIDFASAVSSTWKKVKQRDWIAYPETGLPAPTHDPVTGERIVEGHVVDTS